MIWWQWLIVIVAAGLMICGVLYFWHRMTLKNIRLDTYLKNKIEISDIFIILEFIVKVETDLYETFLETNSNTNLSTLTNSEFLNIYNDLSKSCLKAISPTMWEIASVYVNKTTVQTYVTQRVMSYLTSKIHEELDDE